MDKENFLTYLKDKNSADIKSLFTFAVETLNFANQVHIYHWSCESGFHHTHFQEIYEKLRDFADKLVEISLGKEEFSINPIPADIDGKIYNTENALRKLRKYIDDLIVIAKKFEAQTAINNLMTDTIEALEGEFGLISKFS
jgi:DNA-binding ferritin-like protein